MITYWERHGKNKQQQSEVIGLAQPSGFTSLFGRLSSTFTGNVPLEEDATAVVVSSSGNPNSKRKRRERHNAGCLRFCGRRRKHDKDYWLKRFLIGIWIVIIIISIYNRYFGDHSSHNVRRLLEKYEDIPIPGVPTAVEHTIRHASETTGWMDNMSLGDWYDSHVPRVNHRYRNMYASHNISVTEL
jgi:hypothetical protein